MTRTWRDGTPAKVAVRAIGDAGATVRAYFDVRGPGVLVDTYALQHAAPPNVTLGSPGSISFPVMNTGEATDTFAFTATGLPAGWTASIDTKTLGAGAGSTATITVTPPLTAAAGLYTLNATGTSQTDASVTSSCSFTVNVVRRPTTIVYTGAIGGDYHDGAHLQATLTDTLSGMPLAAENVDFALGTQTASAITNGGGIASTTLAVDQAPASVPVGASFAGDGTYLPSSDTTHSFTITREETSLAFTGPTVILTGSSGATLTARLVEDGANDDDGDGGSPSPSPAGQVISFTLGMQACTGTTDAAGIASCTISNVSSGSLGSVTLKTAFAGDTYYLASTDSDEVLLFAFPSRGVFVVGDSTATSTVTWWSHSWSQLNNLSARLAPPAFKGFADSLSGLPTQSPAGTCGGTFDASPANSGGPPDDVPSYMGVLVAGSITKRGADLRGSWGSIVVVRTDAGYAPSPGHAGTGMVVATFCP
jgi:hypothetical protein